jgi:hypothetical protein
MCVLNCISCLYLDKKKQVQDLHLSGLSLIEGLGGLVMP